MGDNALLMFLYGRLADIAKTRMKLDEEVTEIQQKIEDVQGGRKITPIVGIATPTSSRLSTVAAASSSSSSTAAAVPKPPSTAHPTIPGVRITEAQLKQMRKYRNNIEVDGSGVVVAVACHICYATSRVIGKPRDENNPFFTLAGLRMHYSRGHGDDLEDGGIGLSLDDIFSICRKTKISAVDVEKIMGGEEPRSRHLAVYYGETMPYKKRRAEGEFPPRRMILGEVDGGDNEADTDYEPPGVRSPSFAQRVGRVQVQDDDELAADMSAKVESQSRRADRPRSSQSFGAGERSQSETGEEDSAPKHGGITMLEWLEEIENGSNACL